MDELPTMQDYEEQASPMFNTGGGIVDRINYLHWMILEAFRIKDYSTTYYLLVGMLDTLSGDIKPKDLTEQEKTEGELRELLDKWNTYCTNFSRNRAPGVFTPPKEFPIKLHSWYRKQQQIIKTYGLGMPDKPTEFDAI